VPGASVSAGPNTIFGHLISMLISGHYIGTILQPGLHVAMAFWAVETRRFFLARTLKNYAAIMPVFAWQNAKKCRF
jgi:hypothetical protein